MLSYIQKAKIVPKKFLVKIIFFTVCSISLFAAAGDWRDTLKWLEANYTYPDSGPNYDWPSSYQPILQADNTIQAIDGTKIQLPTGAYEITLQEGSFPFKTPDPQASLSFRVKCAGQSSCQKVYDDIAKLTKKYGLDLQKLTWKQNDSSVTIQGGNDSAQLEILSPGKSSGKNISYPEEEDYFSVSLTILGIEHFYFDRFLLKVNGGKVTLTDGTGLSLLPGKKINKVSVGNVQGTPVPTVLVSYTLTVFDKSDLAFKKKYADEFVKTYSFYAKTLGFPTKSYKLWDEDSESFIISYNDSKIEVRIKVTGQKENEGFATNIDSFIEKDKASRNGQEAIQGFFSYIWVEVYFKNKKQIIPGTDEPLPKSGQ